MNKIVKTTRTVVEKQLLDSLSDKTKVAILCDKQDLETLIAALLLSETNRMAMPAKWRDLRLGLEQLRDAAFPK